MRQTDRQTERERVFVQMCFGFDSRNFEDTFKDHVVRLLLPFIVLFV